MRHAAQRINVEGMKKRDDCPSDDKAGEMLQRDAVQTLKFDAAHCKFWQIS
jgi:hypothetical protein